MNDRIKWLKLKNISQRIVGRKVEINLSTMIDHQITSIVEFNDDLVIISLNAEQCEEINKIIEAISHELAHVKKGSIIDDIEHRDIWKDISDRITESYFKKGGADHGRIP